MRRLGDQIAAGRGVATRNTPACLYAQQWAVCGQRCRGHGAVAFLGSGARQDCLIVAASRNCLGTHMVTKGATKGSNICRNRLRSSRRGATRFSVLAWLWPARCALPIRRRLTRRQSPSSWRLLSRKRSLTGLLSFLSPRCRSRSRKSSVSSDRTNRFPKATCSCPAFAW